MADEKSFDSKKILIEELDQSNPADIGEKINTKKRGRPAGSIKAKAEVENELAGLQIGAETLKPLLNKINNWLGIKYDPVVKMSDDELSTISTQGSIILNKYIPELLTKYGAEVGLGLFLIFMTGEKMAAYSNVKIKRLETKPMEQKTG